MTRTPISGQFSNSSGTRSTGRAAIHINPNSIIQGAKQSALPKELTLSVHFSYRR
jgi:hypothetical protein